MALSSLGRLLVNVVVTWYRESGPSMTWEPFGAEEHLGIATTMYREMGMMYWLAKGEAEMAN